MLSSNITIVRLQILVVHAQLGLHQVYTAKKYIWGEIVFTNVA